MKFDQERWDKRYQSEGFAEGKKPNAFLKRHLGSLGKGVALDLASGEGENAVFLARAGWKVDAVDISPVGVRKARRRAKEAGVNVNFRQADLDFYPIAKEKYDLISAFYFWDRRFVPRIKGGLKKGGRDSPRNFHLRNASSGFRGPAEGKIPLEIERTSRTFQGFSRFLFSRGDLPRRGRKKGDRQPDRPEDITCLQAFVGAIQKLPPLSSYGRPLIFRIRSGFKRRAATPLFERGR